MSDPFAFLLRAAARLCVALAVALAVGFALVGGLPAAAQPASAVQTELAGPALVAALRSGGYVVYFRHTATDFSQHAGHRLEHEVAEAQQNRRLQEEMHAPEIHSVN